MKDRYCFIDDPRDVEEIAQALADGAIVAHAFANFYVITTSADEATVRRINLLKGRPADQVGSVITTVGHIDGLFDWRKLPDGLTRATVRLLIDALYESGPLGFRGPAAAHIPDHMTCPDGGVRTVQLIAPGYQCPSNGFLDSALKRSGESFLYVTSANRSRQHYARHAGPGRSQQRKDKPKVLTVENVTMGMVVKNMSFSVYAGEVVGVAGLIGSGRTEIAKVIYGALKRNLIDGGTIKLHGKPVRFRVPKQAINAGICYLTEDRKLNGFLETMRIDENIYIGKLSTKVGWRFLLSRVTRNKLAALWIDRLKIAALQRQAKIIELSGGNQQKVVIAKSLVQDPSIVIFDEPTRGVDVATIPEIHAQIRRLAEEGKAVVVISSYLPEIRAVSDRILVARLGRIVAEFDAAAASEDKIMYAAIH
jgi:ABC-type multidrug transport system ATPase subunit/tRNA A37 threonylcarbamoyladenosine synthetase subunit TsaC/SUA5/YrdC